MNKAHESAIPRSCELLCRLSWLMPAGLQGGIMFPSKILTGFDTSKECMYVE